MEDAARLLTATRQCQYSVDLTLTARKLCQDELLTINFDVTMLDVDCSHLTVGRGMASAWCSNGSETGDGNVCEHYLVK